MPWILNSQSPDDRTIRPSRWFHETSGAASAVWLAAARVLGSFSIFRSDSRALASRKLDTTFAQQTTTREWPKQPILAAVLLHILPERMLPCAAHLSLRLPNLPVLLYLLPTHLLPTPRHTPPNHINSEAVEWLTSGWRPRSTKSSAREQVCRILSSM